MPASGNRKRAGAAVLTPHRTDLKSKPVTRDEEGHYIIIKGLIHRGGPDSTVHRYTQQMLAAPKVEIYNTAKTKIHNKYTTMQNTAALSFQQRWIIQTENQ